MQVVPVRHDNRLKISETDRDKARGVYNIVIHYVRHNAGICEVEQEKASSRKVLAVKSGARSYKLFHGICVKIQCVGSELAGQKKVAVAVHHVAAERHGTHAYELSPAFGGLIAESLKLNYVGGESRISVYHFASHYCFNLSGFPVGYGKFSDEGVRGVYGNDGLFRLKRLSLNKVGHR